MYSQYEMFTYYCNISIEGRPMFPLWSSPWSQPGQRQSGLVHSDASTSTTGLSTLHHHRTVHSSRSLTKGLSVWITPPLLPIMIVIWLVKMLCCSLSVGQPVVCCTCDRLLLPHQHQPDLVLSIRVSLHSTALTSSLLSPLSSLLSSLSLLSEICSYCSQ